MKSEPKIIDLSCKNTVTNLTNVLNNVDGIILRIGYRGYGSKGTLVEDTKFKKYMPVVLASGKPWGVYMINQAITKEEGVGEAVFVDSILKNYDKTNLKLGVWCDSEKSGGRGDKLSPAVRTTCVLAMVNKMESLGYLAGIYASDSWLRSKLTYSKIQDKYIWNASYGSNNGKITSNPKNRADLFQYTSRYVISGVKSGVDMSVLLNMDILNAGTTSEVKPVETPVKPEANKVINPYIKAGKKEVLSKKKAYIQSREHVKHLQFALIQGGFLPKTNIKGKSNIDGIYGKDTFDAVVKFQKKNKVSPDGVAGPVTNALIG